MILYWAFLSASQTTFTLENSVVKFSGNGDCTPLGEIKNIWPINIIGAIFSDEITDVGEKYFVKHLQLAKVQLSAKTKVLRYDCFSGCSSLNDISFPSSINQIQDRAFAGCIKLASVKYVGTNLIISSNAFNGCLNLQSVSLSANSLSLADSAFISDALTSIKIISQEVTMSNLTFAECKNLKNVHLEGFEIVDSKNQALDVLFKGLPIEVLYYKADQMEINSIAINNFNNLTNCTFIANNIDCMVIHNQNLKVLYVNRMKYMHILYLPNLEELYIGGNIRMLEMSTPKIRKMVVLSNSTMLPRFYQTYQNLTEFIAYEPFYLENDCFANQKYLESFEIRRTDNCRNTSRIYKSAFVNCTSLKTVSIDCYDIEPMVDPFEGCSSLRSFNVSVDNSFETRLFRSKMSLKNVSISAKYTIITNTDIFYVQFLYVKGERVDIFFGSYSMGTKEVILDCETGRIYDKAFADCLYINKIQLPKRLEYLGSYAFTMTNISFLEVPLGIKKIPSWLCCDCRELIEVTFKDNITEIGANAFPVCPKLERIGPMHFVETIGNSAFTNCRSLVNIEFNNISSIGKSAFYSCIKLQLSFGDSKVSTIGESAFRNTPITSLDFSNSPGLVLYPYSFYECQNLTSVIFSSVIEINSSAFCGCSSLKELSINSTLMYRISNYSFCNCSSLTAATISGRIRYIQECAFLNCTSLQTFDVRSDNDICYFESFILRKCSELTSISISCYNARLMMQSFAEINGPLEYFNISSDQIYVEDYLFVGSMVKHIEMKGKILFASILRPFDHADNVETINLIDSFENKLEIPEHFHCRSLKTLFIQAGKITMSYLYGTEVLQNLILKANSTSFSEKMISNPVKNIIIEGAFWTCQEAFMNLKSLQNFTVYRNNRSNETSSVEIKTFFGLTSLKHLYFDCMDIHTRMEAFGDCISLEDVKIKCGLLFTTDSFRNCSSLSVVEIIGENIDLLFDLFDCNNIKNITIIAERFLHWDTQTMNYSKLQEIRLNGTDISLDRGTLRAPILRRVYINYSTIKFNKFILDGCPSLNFASINGIDYDNILDYSTLNMTFFDFFKGCGFSEVRNVNRSTIGNELANYPNLEFVSFSSNNITNLTSCFTNNPRLHTIFFSAFQAYPKPGLLEIPPTVQIAYRIISGNALIKELIIPVYYNFVDIIYNCSSLEKIHIKEMMSPIDHLIMESENLKLILLPLNISYRISHLTHLMKSDAEVYYCGSENIYTQRQDMFIPLPKTVYVTKMYAGDKMAYVNVTRIPIDKCMRMIGEFDGPESNCNIKEKSQALDILPIFLFMSILHN